MMDTAEIGVLIAGISLILSTLWFFFGGRSEKSPAAADGATVDGAVVYACPMHPWITSSDPAADCSICGMKLTRKD